jgi:hypothetical protein
MIFGSVSRSFAYASTKSLKRTMEFSRVNLVTYTSPWMSNVVAADSQLLKELLVFLKKKEKEYEECYAALVFEDRLKNLLILVDEEVHTAPDAVQAVTQRLDEAEERDQILFKALSQSHEFEFSVYGPLRGFFAVEKDQNLIQGLKLAGFPVVVPDSKVYIYCYVHNKDEKMLRDILVGKQNEAETTAEKRGGCEQIQAETTAVTGVGGAPKFINTELAHILCQPEGIQLANTDSEAAEYIDRIVVEALKPNDSRIELIQARRRLSIRELMDIPLVRKCGLRIEETLQAPCFR